MKGEAGMFLVEEDGAHAVVFMDCGETYKDEVSGALTMELLVDVEVLDGDED
jgi:hypothetical protein